MPPTGTAGQVSHVHLAFQAADRATVDRFHAAGLAAGGRDNGAPGERSYHPGYYAAFLLDPDGNNIEAVHHGPATRSAPYVAITPEAPGERAAARRGRRARRIGGVLMEIRHITLRFGGVTAIRDISFDIREGEIRAIIGPNGAGKSSMLNVINGFYHPQEGEIWFRGAEARPDAAARDRPPGHRAHLPEHRALQGHDRRSTTS